MTKARKVVLSKKVIGDELYLYANGQLIFKRWVNHNYSKVFHELEGETQWAR